jgi:arginine/lysine/ornithine decarboxylase
MIEPEFFDRDTLVLMSNPMITDAQLDTLVSAIRMLGKRPVQSDKVPPLPEKLVSRMSPREAMLSSSESVPTQESLGRICASPTVSCPPAVPIVMSGELISERAVELMLYYGIEEIEVIRNN